MTDAAKEYGCFVVVVHRKATDTSKCSLALRRRIRDGYQWGEGSSAGPDDLIIARKNKQPSSDIR